MRICWTSYVYFLLLSLLWVQKGKVHSYKVNVTIQAPSERSESQLGKFVEPFSPFGRFATGTIVGFAGSRLAIQAAVRLVKIGGTLFIVSEVLNSSGYLNIDYRDEFNGNFFKKMEVKSKRAIDDFRKRSEKGLEQLPGELRQFIRDGFSDEREKVNHLKTGIAVGAVTGFLL